MPPAPRRPAPATRPSQPTKRPARIGPCIRIKGRRILLCDKIYFKTPTSVIHRRSYKILSELAIFLKARPKIPRVRIESHTDARGMGAYNRRKSQERAEAIRDYLAGKGLASLPLKAVGVGEDKPIDPRSTPEAWAKNRRIEFHLP